MGNSRWGRRNEALLRTLKALLLGQLVSFVMALTTFASSLAANRGVNTPISLSFMTYLLLTLVNGSILLYRRQKLLFMAGNKSYQYTSITSVTLLDCFTIAWVMILTWIFLGTRYTLHQLFGAAVCLLGLCLVLVLDSGVGGRGGSKPLLGDLLIIAATFFFAISDSCAEFWAKWKDRVEALAMVGLFGLIMTLCEIGTLERKNLESVKWSTEIMSGATMFNLSLLTSDMWAVLIRILFYHQQVDWLYYFSFGIVVIGLVIYSKFEKDRAPLPAVEDGNFNPEYQRLNGESADS